MTNLEAHAKYELEQLGEDPDMIEGYLKVIRAFAELADSGGSTEVAIPVLSALFKFENLTRLTDNPNEWIHHDEDAWGQPGGIWQNIRNPAAFSSDGGKTYYIIDEQPIQQVWVSQHKEL